MEKNYNYNYENRANAKSKGGNVIIGNLQSASCKSSELKKQAVCNGRLWHTTDTNKFYFDWNGKRQELNVSGDNAALEAEIAKIKADMKNLNPDAVQTKLNQLETKVNNAASQANTAKSAAQTAQQQAAQAAQDAQDAAAQVSGKADVSYVDEAVSHAFDNLTDAQKEELRGPAGAAGKDGKDGVDGQDGAPGRDGVDGQDGAPGKDGVDGAPGKDGVDGKDGEDGLSAYEVAVTAGFNGTVEAWLESLKGADGKDGVDGKDGEGLSQADRDKIDALPSEGIFPTLDVNGDEVPNTKESGFATIDAVVAYVNDLVSKKKVDDDSESEVPTVKYLFTNGYKIGDPAIELDSTNLNAYAIEFDDNDRFEIELLHKNESDGYFDPDDAEGSNYGTYFKVMVPAEYQIEVHLWDKNNNVYKADDASLTDRAFSLVPKDASQYNDITTYYYKDAVDNFMFSGAKFGIEATINDSYNGHLIKLVIKK
jgi:hypothetical protein